MNVIMFHSVGNVGPVWYRNWLSVDQSHFEIFCKYLKNNNFKTILLDEWYYLEDNKEKATGKELVLTFDDGYLDNWVYAYPILKKYGLKGTIFINPEFVDPSSNLRPNYDDFLQKKVKEIKSLGFMNWNEIIEVDKSGIMDIQSHSMSHNFYFHTNKIIDIYEGQPEYDWLSWYSHPERKPFYLTDDQTHLTKFGTPIYEFYRALGLRRYFPDKEIENLGVENFNKLSKKELINLLELKQIESPGKFETDDEMEKRYRYEIFESKSILEEKLSKKVDFLCWPGGGYNELSVRLSIEAGYKASTIGSRERNQVLNNSGKYKRIQRFGLGSFINVNSHKYFVKNKSFMLFYFRGRDGNMFYKNICRMIKLWFIFVDFFKKNK